MNAPPSVGGGERSLEEYGGGGGQGGAPPCDHPRNTPSKSLQEEFSLHNSYGGIIDMSV